MKTIQPFNLTGPPGFRGLHPDLPVRIYHRCLPHWRQEGATYFATFRLADSIPRQHLATLKRWRAVWERQHPEPRHEREWHELVREVTHRTEAWLDEGYGELVFKNNFCAQQMSDSLLHFQETRCQINCFTIMGNHVHAVLRPFPGYELEELLGSVKRFVAKKVNLQLNRQGALWSPESYDQIVRDEEHLYRIVQYIGRNPAKAKIPREQWHRWIHPAWVGAGWDFEV